MQHRRLYYNTYIKYHLEYCCVVRGSSTNSNVYKIEKFQRRACKLILGKVNNTLEAALNELQILSFDETVFLHKAKCI